MFLPQGVRVLTNDTITTGEEEAKTLQSPNTHWAGDCCFDVNENEVSSHSKLRQKSHGGGKFKAVKGLNFYTLGFFFLNYKIKTNKWLHSCCVTLTRWSRYELFRPRIMWHQRAICPVYPSTSEERRHKLGARWLPCLVHVFISLTAAGAGSRLPKHLLRAAGRETGTLWVHGGLPEPFRTS